MSESFESALEKVDYGRYISQIQDELGKVTGEVGPGKKPEEVEAIQERLQALIRKQARELSKEVGLLGNHVMVFMMATSIIATAWVSFTLRRETSDLAKAPEDRLATIEMLDALDLALAKVVHAASNYADRYPGAQPGSAVSESAETKTTE